MKILVMMGILGAAGTIRRLDINLTIRANADKSSAELVGSAENQRYYQEKSRCGQGVLWSLFH